MNRIFVVIAAVSALACVACAGPNYRWQANDADAAQAQRDLKSCRAQADRKVLSATNVNFNETFDYNTGTRSNDAMDAVRQTKAREKFDMVVEDCMIDRGYRLVAAE